MGAGGGEAGRTREATRRGGSSHLKLLRRGEGDGRSRERGTGARTRRASGEGPSGVVWGVPRSAGAGGRGDREAPVHRPSLNRAACSSPLDSGRGSTDERPVDQPERLG